jgi:hypothetical protein
VAWRRRSWRCRRSRWCRCPCSGLAPSPDADGLLSSPRAAVEVVVLGVSTTSRCVRSFPQLDAAATRLLPLPHGVASGVGRKTPKGLVVGALGLRPHPAFESRGRGRQGESPNLPRARPAGRPRRRRLPSRQTGCRGAMRGGKSRIPAPSQVGSVRTHAPAPRRAGPLSGVLVPSPARAVAARVAWCDSSEAGRRYGRRRRGKVAADAWALPVSE